MSFLSRMSLTLAGTAVFAAVALTGAAPAQAEKVLRVKMHSDLTVLDPIATTAYIVRNHGYMIYDTLFSMDEKLKVHPQMVDTYEISDDKLIYTFTLRDGLKFHDGSPVTTADVIPSLQRWGKRDGLGQALMRNTESMEAVDDKTFTLKLKSPFGLVLEGLGKMSSNVPFIMPKAVAETPSDKFTTETIGSGPFKFDRSRWQPGSKVVYVKNTDYVPRKEPISGLAGGKAVHFDTVEWNWIPDANTAINALANDEIDYLENPTHELLPILKDTPGVTIFNLNKMGSQGMLRFNHLHPPFDNVKIRRAAAMAVRQADYMQAGIGDPDYFIACRSYYPCDTTYATERGADGLMLGDIEGAKKLLAEAGYDGTPVTLMQSTHTTLMSSYGAVTAQWLRKAGFAVDLQAMDWQTLVSRRSKKVPPSESGWNAFATNWVGTDIIDPIVTQGFSGGCQESAWFGWPCDETIEKLRSDFASESDPEKKKELAAQVQERAYEIVTHLPLGQYFSPIAYGDKVKGVWPSVAPVFWGLDFES